MDSTHNGKRSIKGMALALFVASLMILSALVAFETDAAADNDVKVYDDTIEIANTVEASHIPDGLEGIDYHLFNGRGILTLTGVDFVTTASKAMYISATIPITIVIREGTNRFVSLSDSSTQSYGIHSPNAETDITIIGLGNSGTLTVKSGDVVGALNANTMGTCIVGNVEIFNTYMFVSQSGKATLTNTQLGLERTFSAASAGFYCGKSVTVTKSIIGAGCGEVKATVGGTTTASNPVTTAASIGFFVHDNLSADGGYFLLNSSNIAVTDTSSKMAVMTGSAGMKIEGMAEIKNNSIIMSSSLSTTIDGVADSNHIYVSWNESVCINGNMYVDSSTIYSNGGDVSSTGSLNIVIYAAGLVICGKDNKFVNGSTISAATICDNDFHTYTGGILAEVEGTPATKYDMLTVTNSDVVASAASGHAFVCIYDNGAQASEIPFDMSKVSNVIGVKVFDGSGEKDLPEGETITNPNYKNIHIVNNYWIVFYSPFVQYPTVVQLPMGTEFEVDGTYADEVDGYKFVGFVRDDGKTYGLGDTVVIDGPHTFMAYYVFVGYDVEPVNDTTIGVIGACVAIIGAIGVGFYIWKP